MSDTVGQKDVGLDDASGDVTERHELASAVDRERERLAALRREVLGAREERRVKSGAVDKLQTS